MIRLELDPQTQGHLDGQWLCDLDDFETLMHERFGPSIVVEAVREERTLVHCFYTEEPVDQGGLSYPMHLGSWHKGRGWVFKYALSQEVAR